MDALYLCLFFVAACCMHCWEAVILAPGIAAFWRVMETSFLILWMLKFWNMSQNSNVINDYRAVTSQCTCGLECHKRHPPNVSSEVGKDVPGFVKDVRPLGMDGTSGVLCPSVPFLKDLSLVLASSMKSCEMALVGIGQTKGRESVSIFNQTFAAWCGGKDRTAPNLGASQAPTLKTACSHSAP